jgi:predicted  nucleic acid-binding Zn-ribbon protein
VSTQAEIEALETLSRLDQELVLLEQELEKEREVLGGKRVHLQQLEAKLTAVRQSTLEMERVRNELITEVRQMSLQLERSREKLGRSRTEREVNAAQRESEELRKLYRDREIETQKLVGLIEQAHKEREDTSELRDAVATELGQSAGAAETRVDHLEAEAGSRRAEREVAAKGVPPVLYRRYEMIRKRRGSAICHTVDGTCSACHISLAPMAFQVLRRGGGIDQCPSCNRIMYYREVPLAPKEDDSAKSGSAESGSAEGD